MNTLTEREAQILYWIKENPLISHQELAAKAAITRSSASVHVSNLIKKGFIKGKGYILHNQQPITVIGAVNQDIKAISTVPFIPSDSNPGTVNIASGGVGYNIARNLALLGLSVRFITAFGSDSYARTIKEECFNYAIDIADSLTVTNAKTSSYVCIHNEHGDMVAAVSDMNIYTHITPDFLAGKMQAIQKSSFCIIDANIPAESILFLAENCSIPLIAEPVSTHKIEKLVPVLHKLYAISPNFLEAKKVYETLTNNSLPHGAKNKLHENLDSVSAAILATGLKRLYISLGAQGLFCTDGAEKYLIPAYAAAALHNTTGAGDTQTAGIIWATIKNMSFKQTAQAGVAAAALCLETEEAVNTALSEEALYEHIRIIS